MSKTTQLAAGARPVPAALLGRVQANAEPARVLADLTAAVTDLRERTDGRVQQLEASVDDLNRQLAATRLNGHSPGAPTASRKAIGALGRFAKTGDATAMRDASPQAGMRVGSDPDGGYLVPDEVSSTIYTLQRNISPMRRLARVVLTNSQDYKQPVSKGGASSGWVTETEGRPETLTPKLSMLTFPAGEIYANPGVTQLLLDDNDFNLGDFLTQEIAREFDEKEGAAFVTGDGINKPRGFLNYDTYENAGADDFGKIQFVRSGNATLLNDADKLIAVLHAMKAGHRRTSTWLMNSTTQQVVAQLKDLNGQYLWQRALAAGVPDTLLGRPVELDENMPDIGAGAFPIALGNWSDAYLVNDRMGVRILRDPYSNKPYVMFYATKRVGGGVLDSEAIKLLKIAS